jgi:hypothetical protein
MQTLFTDAHPRRERQRQSVDPLHQVGDGFRLVVRNGLLQIRPDEREAGLLPLCSHARELVG